MQGNLILIGEKNPQKKVLVQCVIGDNICCVWEEFLSVKWGFKQEKYGIFS